MTNRCDNCLREIEKASDVEIMPGLTLAGEWVHTNTGGPECWLDDGRLDLGASAMPERMKR